MIRILLLANFLVLASCSTVQKNSVTRNTANALDGALGSDVYIGEKTNGTKVIVKSMLLGRRGDQKHAINIRTENNGTLVVVVKSLADAIALTELIASGPKASNPAIHLTPIKTSTSSYNAHFRYAIEQ